MLNYFRSSTNRAADKRTGQALMQKIHNEFSNVFQESGVLKAHLAYRQRRAADNMRHLQEGDGQTAEAANNSILGAEEKSDWCNCFVLVSKANGKVYLYLDQGRRDKVLNRPVHRGPTLNAFLHSLAGVKCLTLNEASSYYLNLKLDEQSSYLTTFSCPFGIYRYMQLPYGVTPVGDMFQKKTIEKIYNGRPIIFSIADDILIAGFDKHDRDYNTTLDKALRIYRQVNMKLNKDKCLFRCTSIPFFDEVIPLQGVSPIPEMYKG